MNTVFSPTLLFERRITMASQKQFQNFEKRNGLLIAIIQDADTKEVLMHGFMNRAALWLTRRERTVWLWSTSQKRLWHKGETSGSVMEIRWLKADCDCDAILIGVKVGGKGDACHLERRSCFDQFISQDMITDRLIFSDVSDFFDADDSFEDTEDELTN